MKRALAISLVVAAFLSGLAQNVGAFARPNQQQKSRIVRQIKSSHTVEIYADNSQGSKLIVEAAAVREISGDDFSALVGQPSKHFKQTTFPEINLVNGSSKTITSFALVVQSAVDQPRSGYILLKKNLSIPPNSVYKVASGEWPPAERVSIQKGDKFVTRSKQPGLDSAKSWLNGAASDLRVTVGLVEFEDGTSWKISSDSGW